MADLTDPNTPSAGDTCPVCKVTITNNEVRFSTGQPGTRARLYARVCKYANNPKCINQDPDLIGEVLREDGYIEGENLKL
ncbi:MAG: hypothetical protein AAF152_12495 [Cyanobacteria bacterium P01_A01_bin.114]